MRLLVANPLPATPLRLHGLKTPSIFGDPCFYFLQRCWQTQLFGVLRFSLPYRSLVRFLCSLLKDFRGSCSSEHIILGDFFSGDPCLCAVGRQPPRGNPFSGPQTSFLQGNVAGILAGILRDFFGPVSKRPKKLGCRKRGCNEWELKERLPSLPGNRLENPENGGKKAFFLLNRHLRHS